MTKLWCANGPLGNPQQTEDDAKRAFLHKWLPKDTAELYESGLDGRDLLDFWPMASSKGAKAEALTNNVILKMGYVEEGGGI